MYPPKGGTHGSRVEEVMIDVVHVLDFPPMWSTECCVTIWIDAGIANNQTRLNAAPIEKTVLEMRRAKWASWKKIPTDRVESW